MVTFPALVWFALAAIGAISVLGMLHAAATRIQDEVCIHDLRVQVCALRISYLRRVAEESGGLGDCEIIEAEIIDDEPMPAAA